MDPKNDDPVTKARLETRDYVWKHWAFHAEQRLRAFHFFILVVTVILAGLLTYIKDARYPHYAAPGCFLLPVLCWIFWRLDCRSRDFIRHAEHILQEIERAIPPDVVPSEQQLFVQMEIKTENANKANREESVWKLSRWWHAPLTFYYSFRALFFIFGIFGIGLGIIALLLPNQQPAATPTTPQQSFYIGTHPLNPVPEKAP